MFTHVTDFAQPHSHASVGEARLCEQAARQPITAMATDKQYKFIKDLCDRKGVGHQYVQRTKQEASAEIDRLLAMPDKPTEVKLPREDPNVKYQQQLQMIELMLPKDGRYAVRELTDGELKGKTHFLRITRHKPTAKNRWAGGITIQTKHGGSYTDKGNLELRLAKWPSGKWSVYSPWCIDVLLLILPDPTTAAMLYSQELGECARCGKDLTDERSRFYGIGPECEKHWPHHLDRVVEIKGGTYERVGRTY